MAQKYYYIKYINKQNDKYFATITPAKCERSALFWINQKYQIPKDMWDLSRCEEISYKIFARLENWQNIHLKKLEEERKKEPPTKLNKALSHLLWVTDLVGKMGPYYHDNWKK